MSPSSSLFQISTKTAFHCVRGRALVKIKIINLMRERKLRERERERALVPSVVDVVFL